MKLSMPTLKNNPCFNQSQHPTYRSYIPIVSTKNNQLPNDTMCYLPLTYICIYTHTLVVTCADVLNAPSSILNFSHTILYSTYIFRIQKPMLPTIYVYIMMAWAYTTWSHLCGFFLVHAYRGSKCTIGD